MVKSFRAAGVSNHWSGLPQHQVRLNWLARRLQQSLHSWRGVGKQREGSAPVEPEFSEEAGATATVLHYSSTVLPIQVTLVTPAPLPEPEKRVLPKLSVAARIERDYHGDLMRIIEGDAHFNRIDDFVRETVLGKIDRWKRERPTGRSTTRERSKP